MTIPAQVGGRLRSWWDRPETRGVFFIWAAMTIVLEVFSVYVPARLMGPPASPTMHAVENTMTVFTIAASPVAAAVWSVALYSLLAWRHRGANQPTVDGPPIRGNTPVTAIWLVLSSLLCVFLLIWGLAAMQSVTAAAAGRVPLEVDVTGQQWVWSFNYPDQKIDSQDLYLPVDEPVVFHVTSKDVIHSFWVVQMGIKVDANPGETTKTNVTPNKIGTYVVRCAELCGLLHADMESTVHVVSAQDFAAWVRTNTAPVRAPAK
jgi:cytochrome c oxidase subunit II